MISSSELSALEFGARGEHFSILYIAILAIVDISALMLLFPSIPAWVHVVVTLTLSLIALLVCAMSLVMKHKNSKARGETVRKLVDMVNKLSVQKLR